MTETVRDIKNKIEQILSFIKAAERLIYDGKMVDIAALQGHITHLCQDLQMCPQAEARSYLTDLNTLFEAVERLEKDITLQHDALTERLKFTGGRVNPLMAQEINDDDNET
ncbi:MAG: hypothetical protein ACNI26_14265 [Terasakiella sp.]|uniref:hypothetical protein n=1 Tax=unclassified Terasakiella TaxID=2614952 RepID=UPI003B006B70